MGIKVSNSLFKKLIGEILNKKRMICPVCGKELLPHWKFCPYDGTKL